MNKIASIYLAGPWFTPEQLATQRSVEDLCIKYDRAFFSPRLECLCPPDASPSVRSKAFSMNVKHVKDSYLVLANIEGLDAGTIWELGAAYAYGTKAVAYSPNPNRKLNLMLAESCHGYLQGMEEVERFLKDNFKGNTNGLHTLNWEVAKKWKQEIV